ncbi:MAG: ABC-F family ATP-binding cassette domain-containing protein [Sphaerochaetaceae bacterium]
MGTLQIQNISLAYGDNKLLNRVSLTLSTGEHVALAGSNGSGKSTLLKIIKGLLASDEGNVILTKGMRISYLPQGEIVHAGKTLYDEVEQAFSRFEPLLERKEALEKTLSVLNEEEEHLDLTNELDALQEELLRGSYYRREALIFQILKGLGFDREDFNRPCHVFSGGWQMRIALAKVLAEEGDVMLLDEPTNYLDIDSLLFLRSFINKYKGIAIIVSHDQDFLDETVSVVYELFNGQLTAYKGNYTHYLVQREEELAQAVKRYREQALQRAKTEQFIERFRYKASKARQVQSRIKQLEKSEIVEIPDHLKRPKFTFPPGGHSPNEVLVVQELEKHYGSLQVFKDFSLLVNKGDRLAVTGRNGSGKTTLLRIISQVDHDYSGKVKLGNGVKIGYFTQDSVDSLTLENSVLEEVEAVAHTSAIPSLRSLLGAFLFSGDEVHKKVSVLSGGERSRLALAKILLQSANLLILDEPTSHLDIATKNVLLEALQSYQGSLIFVSHDTHFIKNIATRILYLSATKEELFEGDWDYFSWKMAERGYFEEEGEERIVNTASLNWQEEKRLKNRLTILKRDADNLLEKINTLSHKTAEVESLMALPENYSDRSKITALVKAQETLEKEYKSAEELWFDLHHTIEELEGQYGF